MKILHVLHNYFPSIGGTQILFQNIAEHCVKDYNDEVEIFATNSLYGPAKRQFELVDPSSEKINGVNVKRFEFYRFHLPFFRAVTRLFMFLNIEVPYSFFKLIYGPWSPTLIAAMKKTDADIIVASPLSSYSYISYSLFRHKLEKPKPFVIQGAIHFKEDETVEVIPKQILESIKKCDYYISNTDFERQRLIELGVDGNSIVNIGPGVNEKIFENGDTRYYREHLNIADDEVLVAYIGRIESTKSIDILLKTMPLVLNENTKVKLVIAGYASLYFETLKKMVSTFSKEHQQRIHFVINLDVQQKINLYHAIDVLVLPSISESFGMVFLESWACKKPVIGTNIGAIRCIVDHEKNGLLVKPLSVNEMSNAIVRLSADKGLRERLGLNGYQKLIQNYTWDIVTKKYRDTYLKAIEKFSNPQQKT